MTLRRILWAGPEPSLPSEIEAQLEANGCEVLRAPQLAAALRLACEAAPDLIFWAFAGAEADARAQGLVRRLPEAALVLVTDAMAAERMLAGPFAAAVDLLRMPATPLDLRLALRRASERVRQRSAVRRAGAELREVAGDHPIVAASPAMIELLEALDRLTGWDAPVLLRGEPGTGKQAIARALHAQSSRRGGPFVMVRCAAADPTALEALLFGTRHSAAEIRRGHFVEADAGTLYLASIDALPAPLQARLLDALRTQQVTRGSGCAGRSVDVRLIASSSRDLRACVAGGTFDGALLDALGKLELHVPPLRERREDLPLLVDHLLGTARRSLGRPIGIDAEALDRLMRSVWPGNLRELQHVIGCALIRLQGDIISPDDLPVEPEAEARTRGERDLGLRAGRRGLEMQMIREALRRTAGNRTHAARLLGISHRALLYKLKAYGLGA